MFSVNYHFLSLFLLWSFANQIHSQLPSFQSQPYMRRPNSEGLNGPPFGLNDSPMNGNFLPLSPFDMKYENNYLRPNPYSSPNFNGDTRPPNPGTKRLIPIGGFPNQLNYGQNGMGFEGFHNSPYNKFQNIHSPHQMLSHLMPHTFNMINNLRASLSAGIPSYGFGYGVINDGFMSMNGGHQFGAHLRPLRTGSGDSDVGDSTEKLSSSESTHSTHKTNRPTL